MKISVFKDRHELFVYFMRPNFLIKFLWVSQRIGLPILTLLTTISVFTKFNTIPLGRTSISWAFAMNTAIAEHLQIGRDIIFTFGPYASLYTELYHPSTYIITLFGGLLIGLCYGFGLLYLSKQRGIISLIGFLFAFIVFTNVKDAFFFTYPLLVVACIYVNISNKNNIYKSKENPKKLLTLMFLIAPMGLLPLIKGSFTLICIFITLLLSFYLYYHKYRKYAIILLFGPLLWSIFFWIISGQSLITFPFFFINLGNIISGYTEAMSLTGTKKEILLYLFGALMVLWVIIRMNESAVNKIFLLTSFAFFLFIAFKGGFVRQDGYHVHIASESLVFAGLIVNFIDLKKHKIYVLCLTVLILAYIDHSRYNTTTQKIYRSFYTIYISPFKLLSGNVSYETEYKHKLELIRKEKSITALPGTTDIYSYDQQYLLASPNKWNPRPIIQSYSAYTPSLAKLNEQHLRKSSAPENILFCVQTIDNRFPSLDDGLSWPALFDNYTVTKVDNDLVYLVKNQLNKDKSTFYNIREGVYKVGESVLIPYAYIPLFAEIDMRVNFLGTLLGIAFKPPQLILKVTLKNGNSTQYRVSSKMMQSGFFLSPMVMNTKDFVFLATGNHHYLNNNEVESLEIVKDKIGSWFWNKTYKLMIKGYVGKDPSLLPLNLLNPNVDSVSF
jgi:hypothetical protein